MYKIVGWGLSVSLLLSLFISDTIAQGGLSYGFKAGLNSSTFSGPLDEDETYKSNTGFHIGIIFRYPITDLFGVKAEFVYNQKGGKYLYNGPSFFRVNDGTNDILVHGTRDMDINVSNNYLEFPVLAYGRLGPLEFSGGGYFALLGGSLGGGQLRFTGQNPAIDQFRLNLDHHYVGDEAGEASTFNTVDISVEGETISLPSQIGAYYEHDDKPDNRYKFLDLGLLGGVSFYLNEGLYLGLRGTFGLTDVSQPSMDVIYNSFKANVPAVRDDKDRQISYQISLGFSF